MNDTTNLPLKRCTKCGEEKPATTDYFNRYQRAKDGLQYTCRECECDYRHKNAEHRKKMQRIYSQQHREKHKQYLVNYYQQNKERVAEQNHAYYLKNKTRINERNRDYNRRNKEKLSKAKHVYYVRNKEWHSEKRRQYNLRNPHVKNASRYRREARKRNLPHTFTAHDWQRALDYFNHCCAVCGRQLKDLFRSRTAAADHWIALHQAGCPGTVPTNIVPLCHGNDGCNNRKLDKLPEQWLTETYGKRKATEILKRITAYFEWVKNQ